MASFNVKGDDFHPDRNTGTGIALIAGRFAVCVSAPFCSARTERGYATSRTWQALVQPDQQPVRDRSAARRR
jgi:hypothetical protein